MELLYKTSATSVGGREGHVRSEDGNIDMDLKRPAAMGGAGGGTNPEELFAAGYAACFNSALINVALQKRMRLEPVTVKVEVSLNKTDEGKFQIGAKIDVQVPGVDNATAMQLAEEAHGVCPYSRATRGNIDVDITARGI